MCRIKYNCCIFLPTDVCDKECKQAAESAKISENILDNSNRKAIIDNMKMQENIFLMQNQQQQILPKLELL